VENELDSAEASSHSTVNNDGCIKPKMAVSQTIAHFLLNIIWHDPISILQIEAAICSSK
jgi:hypothetical protein